MFFRQELVKNIDLLIYLPISEMFFRQELGKSINTDEAAAMGAVYQAAYLSKGFKVKTFSVKDGTIYPIVVSIDGFLYLKLEQYN